MKRGQLLRRIAKPIDPDFDPIQATGGDDVFDVTIDGVEYRVHVFEGSDNFVVTDAGQDGEVDVVVVGGGGGGAFGGGGGGGFFTETTANVSVQTYPVVVGAGGEGLEDTQAGDRGGGTGSQSSVFSIESDGGNGGFTDNGVVIREGGDGGSGGGAGASTDGAVGDGGTNGSDGGSGQRGDGGSGQGTPTETNITGVLTRFSGGGGGAHVGTIVPQGLGGAGGGGNGGRVSGEPENGQVNTGGGGGGVGGTPLPLIAGNGGSGIVIIRYPLTDPNI